MAKLEEVLPALRAGKKVRRGCQGPEGNLWKLFTGEDILASDWEIIENKPHELLERSVVEGLRDPPLFSKDLERMVTDWLLLHDAVLAARRLCSRESTEAWDDLVKALRACGSLPD